MKCEICETYEPIYKYKLNNGDEIDICELCGKVLYEFKIGTQDRLIELCSMINYTTSVRNKELKWK